MSSNVFGSLFDSAASTSISIGDFLLCILASLLAGTILAWIYTYKNQYSKSFVVTLALLPAIVCVVIMMVNGNVGTGVAVAGTFSLVRFRSLPGTAKEIAALFMAMAVGLITGMGYLLIALIAASVLGLVYLLFNASSFGEMKISPNDKLLKITIPEDLAYTDVFTDLFEKYTTKHELVRIKTSNLGSLYKLSYNISMKDSAQEKEFIDLLRCRNGNLEITCARQETVGGEL
ncbi:MAG TPA: DUF4956 domain-containing protein [Clostridiaceae bacterium]|nr:DUF4956 domain-containing protein [Clostridiaceae bacterium]